jgi:hypothetical protein
MAYSLILALCWVHHRFIGHAIEYPRDNRIILESGYAAHSALGNPKRDTWIALSHVQLLLLGSQIICLAFCCQDNCCKVILRAQIFDKTLQSDKSDRPAASAEARNEAAGME